MATVLLVRLDKLIAGGSQKKVKLQIGQLKALSSCVIAPLEEEHGKNKFLFCVWM